MLFKIAIGLVVAVGGLFLYAASRPSQMSVSREILVSASPEVLFPFINNSQNANDWMPWQESDPDAKMQYSGPTEGVGSKSSWNSKGKMGTGEALVVESILNKVVKTQLTYTKPFQMSQLAEISLSPAPGGTQVRWSVSGQSGFFFKLMGIFMDCDKMIGGEFEKGLAKLKARAEAARGGK